MTFEEFKRKWARFSGKESSAYQEHFNDLCQVLGEATPALADPSGAEFFCFQKRVIKDQELFDVEAPDAGEPMERGFADVWKKGCFAWEYKGKKKNLEEAYKQLLRYRESLLNPPLLVVCDFDRYIVRTNFNGTVQEVYEFTNDQIDRPENLRVLRALFADPDFLKPQKTTAEVTEELAGRIAELARSLQKRESVEFEDAKNRKQVSVAQRKNLRIARFLNRIIFCFFAEDSKLLPDGLFTQIAKIALDDPKHFATALEDLFKVMATGGMYGPHKIRHFNGHLFEEATVFELNDEELGILAKAAEADWNFIQPSIMGTLFERALEPEQRSQLGAHYTSEEDIRTLVEPVLMAPLRRKWSSLKGELARAYSKGKGTKADREKLAGFLRELSTITVLDPACGSGNFLYVSLQLLLGLEKEAIAFGTQMGFDFKPAVSVQQLKAIEINPYAYELAQVSVQIGYLQWRRDNGFDNDRTPVLQHLKGFENKDALMRFVFRAAPRTLREARDREHAVDEDLKTWIEAAWPEAQIIVGNPPFLGDKLMRRELGDEYVDELRGIYGNRIPGQSDLCCYWFEKARDLIEHKKCQRAGLLGTQGIRGGANREVLLRIKSTGDIFFAISDRNWFLGGANVHVSMVGFDAGEEKVRVLDGKIISVINGNLTGSGDLTKAKRLQRNSEMSFIGAAMHGPFAIDKAAAFDLLNAPNASGRPNSELIRPWINAKTITMREMDLWIIDVPPEYAVETAALYEAPFKYLTTTVLPIRQENRRPMRARNWWLLGDPQKAMRRAIEGKKRFLVTPRVSKHRIFRWFASHFLATDATVAFATESDYIFGILQSKFHAKWSLSQGTQLREKESGFRYTPTTCFDNFPFPTVNDLQTTEQTNAWADAAHYYSFKEEPASYGQSRAIRTAIEDAARNLDLMRERWINPPEWTDVSGLEFAATLTGPWSCSVDLHSVDDKTGIGVAKYEFLRAKDVECAAKLKKRSMTVLYNEMPMWLQFAHKKLDDAVAAAYGWPVDLSDDEILERLLKLNLERAEAEKNAPVKKMKPKVSREKMEGELI